MKTIGLIPGGFKPYTAGHHSLVELAAKECDEVHLFVSTKDRVRQGEVPIYGKDMLKIWQSYLEPVLPSNVSVSYVSVPVSAVYDDLKGAEEIGEDVSFKIYSDEEDILKYKDESLKRVAPKLFKKGRIKRRGVSRQETVPVSGTMMRGLIASGDVEKFISLLPQGAQKNGKKIFAILKRAIKEEVLREYVRTVLG